MFLGIRSKNIERAVLKDKIDIIVAQTAGGGGDGWMEWNQPGTKISEPHGRSMRFVIYGHDGLFMIFVSQVGFWWL